MKRGEVWWVSFQASIQGEIQKTRPAVIISNDISNKHLNRVQVVPLTSNVKKVYPSEALITFKGKECKAMADQLTTVSKQRLVNYADTLNNPDMRKVEMIVKIQLALRKFK